VVTESATGRSKQAYISRFNVPLDPDPPGLLRVSAEASSGVVFLAGARTGFGTFGGALKDFSATDLGVIAAQGALGRSGLEPGVVDHVVFGNVLQTSADAIYLARHVGLRSGLPIETPAVTVNRLCGSGFEAIAQAGQQIVLGESEVVLAGGTESMSQAPHVVRGARWGLRLGPAAPFEDSLWEALRDPSCGLSMAETAEKLAEKYRISRQAVDCYAAQSQSRAAAGWNNGAFTEEVVPVSIQNRKTRQAEAWAADEHMRPGTTPEALAKLPPYFKKDGVVTAGNASGICDGAAALVLASERFASKRGLRPTGRLVSWASAGVEPSIMGIGPAPAARKALDRAGLKLDDMDLVEVNEAFAAQYLAVEQELGLDRERTNVDGGAIAIGHPLGASGARITLHLLHALRRRGGRYGLGSACIGGGQGAAVIVEAYSG
jgi:acetyl-CoA acyltransferase 2